MYERGGTRAMRTRRSDETMMGSRSDTSHGCERKSFRWSRQTDSLPVESRLMRDTNAHAWFVTNVRIVSRGAYKTDADTGRERKATRQQIRYDNNVRSGPQRRRRWHLEHIEELSALHCIPYGFVKMQRLLGTSLRQAPSSITSTNATAVVTGEE